MKRKQYLLRKYFHHQCSRAELEELLDYLQDGSEDEYQEVVDELWSTLHPTTKLSADEAEPLYAQLQGKMHKQKPFWVSSPSSWRVAATLTGLIFISSLVALYLFKTGRTTHTTGYGEITTIELPDASTVVLNGNSTLRYQDNWDEEELREVWLEGEAYFTVRHLKNNTKFRVHTNNLNIEVLGTEFNVVHRRGDTKVTLNSGSIRLNSPSEGFGEVADVILQPGDQALLTNDQKFELKVVNPELYTSWTDRELIFENTPLWQVSQTMVDTYGVSIHFEDSTLRTEKITGSLPNNDLEVLIGMLREILNVEIKQDKNQIYIRKK